MFVFAIFISIAVFVGITAMLMLAEWQFIKRRKKWKWVVPVITTIVAVFFATQVSWISHSVGGTSSISVYNEDTYIGEVQTVIDNQKHMHAIGSLVIGETEKELNYVNLEYRDGELIGSIEALKYKKDIDHAIGFATKEFTGSTVSMDMLEDAHKKVSEPTKTFSYKYLIKGFAFFGITPLILWFMVLGNKLEQRKNKQLDKTRMEDL